MPYRIELTDKAAAQLGELPEKIQRQIIGKLDLLAEYPRSPITKQIVEHPHLRRIRSGDYRILYQVEDEVLVVLVVRIVLRRDVYRGMPSRQARPPRRREDQR